MRCYSDPGFRLDAWSHPDRAIRRKALDLALRGVDALAEAGGDRRGSAPRSAPGVQAL